MTGSWKKSTRSLPEAVFSRRPRSIYDQVVDLMNNARRLRRKTAKALKIANEHDDTVTEAEEQDLRLTEDRLQEAARKVESVEIQAKILIGRSPEDERIAALKARLRQEIVQEVLDIVSAHVDPTTYQAINPIWRSPRADCLIDSG